MIIQTMPPVKVRSLHFHSASHQEKKNKSEGIVTSHFLNVIYMQLHLYKARWFRRMSGDETIESLKSKSQYQLLFTHFGKGKY